MQVPDDLRKCVCFVEARTAHEIADGTAFFVAVPLINGQDIVYVVTARHCVEPEPGSPPFDEIALRINTKAGGSAEVTTDPEAWIRHPTADVAVLALAPDRDVYDYLYYPIRGSATEEFMHEHRVGPGEEILITGLLFYHPGETRIMPIVRVGNIAAFPDEPIMMSTGEDKVILVEVRSLGGLSGSPAFVHLPDWRRDEDGKLLVLNQDGGSGSSKAGHNYFMGLVHGFYPVGENDPDGITEGIEGSKSGGITVVVPVDRILDIIDSQDFVEQREQLINALKT